MKKIFFVFIGILTLFSCKKVSGVLNNKYIQKEHIGKIYDPAIHIQRNRIIPKCYVFTINGIDYTVDSITYYKYNINDSVKEK